jgi:hypothetical protein
VLTQMGRLTPRVAVAMIVLALTVACQSFGGWSGPALRPAGNPNLSMSGTPAVSPAHHALVGEMLLCLTGSGRAVITAVRPIHPVGTIDVLGFAVRPNPLLKGLDMLGGAYGSLRTNGFPANRTVDAECGGDNSGGGFELALELAIPQGTDAGTFGWTIDYQIGEHAASTTFPAGVVLCSQPSMTDPSCNQMWRRFGGH